MTVVPNITLADSLVLHPKWVQAQVHEELVGVVTVACPRGRRWTRAAGGHGRGWVQVCGPMLRTKQRESMLPDIEHQATKGVLLALLRKACGQSDLLPRVNCDGSWCITIKLPNGASHTAFADDEGELYALALLYAWGKPS